MIDLDNRDGWSNKGNFSATYLSNSPTFNKLAFYDSTLANVKSIILFRFYFYFIYLFMFAFVLFVLFVHYRVGLS